METHKPLFFILDMNEVLRLDNVSYSYRIEDQKRTALNGISFSVHSGEFVCIIGHNGSGKSTLAKLMNALLLPEDGAVFVCGHNTKEENELWKIRRNAGMVFQNPDNQIVSSIVEEDVAFGPENLGMPREKIIECVRRALKATGMTGYEKRSPAMLSGGQKQRVSIAGVMAMLPEVIIFDEPTAMLDPKGRHEVLETIHRLNQRLGKTIILITHFMDEVIDSDKVIVLNKGLISAIGTPREVFAERQVIAEAGLSLPIASELYFALKEKGVNLCNCPISKEELVDELCSLL